MRASVPVCACVRVCVCVCVNDLFCLFRASGRSQVRPHVYEAAGPAFALAARYAASIQMVCHAFEATMAQLRLKESACIFDGEVCLWAAQH